MRKVLCIFILVFASFTGAYAQFEYDIKQAFDFYLNNKAVSELLTPSAAAEIIEGSPYLDAEFIEGSVYTLSKTQYLDVPLRYNIYNDQVEFRNSDEQVLAIAAPEYIEKIEFGKYLMEYIPYLNGKKVSKGYFLVLEKGDACLYCRQNVILEQAKKAVAYQDAVPPRFIRRPDTYYIRIGEGAAKLVSKRKELADIFTGKEKEIDGYINKNKIKPGNAESLIELVAFYNSL